MKADRQTTNLNQSFRSKVDSFIQEANSKGFHIFMTEGKRTRERQRFLFGKGRTEETLRKYGVPTGFSKPNDAQVTWTLQSNHMSGNAIDIAFDPAKHGSLYPSDARIWREVADIAIKHGIDRGYDLRQRDKPHFQDNPDSLPIKDIIMFYKKVREDNFKQDHVSEKATFMDVDLAIENISGLPTAEAVKELCYLNAILFAKLDRKLGNKTNE